MPLILATVLLAASAGSAAAHGTAPLQPDGLWLAWNLSPSVLVPLLLVHWLYGRGVVQLWARAGNGRVIAWRHVMLFAAGEGVLGIALVSPLDALGGTLLAAHMLQHALLVVVAPPLLLAGRPGVAILWALPPAWRRRMLPELWRSVRRVAAGLARPVAAAVVHGGAIWVWHAPALFVAALESDVVHWCEHLSFLATALLFWRAGMGQRGRSAAALALPAVLVTLVHTGLLGALLTLAPDPLYAWYGDRARLWGLEPLADQQLAGLIMWVPMSLAYIGAGLVLAARIVEAVSPSPPPGTRTGRKRFRHESWSQS